MKTPIEVIDDTVNDTIQRIKSGEKSDNDWLQTLAKKWIAESEYLTYEEKVNTLAIILGDICTCGKAFTSCQCWNDD